MNLISAPWEKNASTLQSQYPQLESPAKPQAEAPQRNPAKATKNVLVTKLEPKRQKAAQTKKKIMVREPTLEEEDDSDDGLTVEYPDTRGPKQYNSQPILTSMQLVSESDEDEEEEDTDKEIGDQENQDVDYLTLPSATKNYARAVSDEDIELDLEAELEQALQETTEKASNDESDESEEE